jgi:diguanylate cyclase (GGDEF)-like protein
MLTSSQQFSQEQFLLQGRIKVLILEDVAEDAELLVITLESAQFALSHEVVSKEADFQKQLQLQKFDVVLSDYRLPSFNGLRAFERLQESGQEIPFILITGSLGEEAAVECLKAGITDYVLKDRLFRLPMVLHRALQEFEVRRQRQAAILELEQQAWRESIINRIVQNMRDSLVMDVVLQSTVEQLHAALQVSRCSIVQPNANGQLQANYTHPANTNTPPTSLEASHSSPLYQPYIERLKQGELLSFSRTHDFDTVPAFAAFSTQKNILSLMCIPLMYQQSFLGFISLYQCDRERDWSENELALIRAVTDQCAIAIHQAKLYQQVQIELAERKRFEAQLRHDAFHDTLTGLPNRALFMNRLQHALQLSQRRLLRHHAESHTAHFAVLFLDLDRFKVINDSLGHLIGDLLLQTVAKLLEQCLRAGDSIARLGGDEFVILQEDIMGVNDAIEVSKRILSALKSPIWLDGQEVFVTASIGIALNAPHYTQPAQLLRDADTAMYRAKSRGRGRYEVFDVSMHTHAYRQLQMETDLQRAVENGAFHLNYQPIVCIHDKTVSGMEALVRWPHPQQGMISPLEFIPIAEETGLITAIDLWVLKTTCETLHQWRTEYADAASITISINLSGEDFSQADLIPKIDQILADHHLSGDSLKVEITESVLIQNTDTAAVILEQLKARNIQVCIDDFGTGYSSLSYLHRFPIDTLKIDRSFIMRLGEGVENQEIVKAIVNLGINLGLTVVAEGVETSEQLDFLKRIGCHYGQGYLFSRPIDSQTMTQQLIQQGIWTR